MLHDFTSNLANISLPEKFTYPFHYTPHPLCLLAAKQLQHYLSLQEQWKEELKNGKMFGVLVVKTNTDRLQFIAAFSGNLAQQNNIPYFVPPVFDLLQPNGFFKKEEQQITMLNKKITELEHSTAYLKAQEQVKEAHLQAEKEITAEKKRLKAEKESRGTKRKGQLTTSQKALLIQESQQQKADLKRLKVSWKEQLSLLQRVVDLHKENIDQLKEERKKRSATLQQQLFDQFQFLNQMGEKKGLCSIFEQTVHKTPPAGAGECAAPKLLQYAYLHQLKPIAMAEFWWGASPKTELRRHGHYYPACKGKCEPILKHMLQGLDVEDNPLLQTHHADPSLDIVYEDEWLLVVNKPAGILSVPGKSTATSIYQQVKERYPSATGPLIVHRLDMATSGLLLLAKSKEVHKDLQAQFKKRTIKKRYIALLDAVLPEDSGTIELAICPDPLDRPRQMASDTYGKPAITTYKVLKRYPHQTRVAFYPLTGRTHQLRVHAAHPLGLNAPIVGDELYGKKDSRLHLHADSLTFEHPISKEIVKLKKKEELL
ncbi:MAG: pseudouridine synthase [Bacteroidaceae bacterium]|nr:pseudouridine synthase [Bacteroidaceae bacterium]